MSIVQVVAETDTWQTRKPDKTDEWDRGDTDGRVENVWAELVLDKKANNWYNSELTKELDDVKPGDTVYAVVVDYASGDTFGRSGGYAQIMDVFKTFEEAEGLYRECTAHQELGRERPITQGVSYGGQDYYVAWDGFFESVNSMEVWHLVVRGGSDSNGVKIRTGR